MKAFFLDRLRRKRQTTSLGFVQSSYGVFLKNRKGDITFEFCRDGDYGILLSSLLEEIDGPYVFLDVGANIGLYSLIAEKNSHIEAIHAFEPDPETLPFLFANIEANHCRKIQVHPYALSNIEGGRTLFSTARHSGVSTLQPQGRDKSLVRDVVSVASSYLDAKVSVSDRAKILAKIDVEGHEFFALESLLAWRHAGAIDKLFIEFDTEMSDVNQLTELLRANNFVEIQRSGFAEHWDALWSR